MDYIIQQYLDYYLESVNNNYKDFKIMHKLEDTYLKDNIEYKYKPIYSHKSLYYNAIHAHTYSYYKLDYNMNNYIRENIKKIKNLDYYKNNIIVIYFPGIYDFITSIKINNCLKTIKIPYNIKYIFIAYFILVYNKLKYTLKTEQIIL
jgi:hypothetical protein